MPFKIVRNDITKMECDAIVNTASRHAVNTFEEVGAGCDKAIYKVAGADKLIAARKEIGEMEEGEAAITPGFDLPAQYIIHVVSPAFIDGNSGEEDKLRNCYRNSLRIAKENGIKSIAFPLIATGSFGYPQEEGMRIAVDEINAFLLHHDMMIYLVVFGTKATQLGERIFPDLETYIDHHYVEDKREEEYGDRLFGSIPRGGARFDAHADERANLSRRLFAIRAESASIHKEEVEENYESDFIGDMEDEECAAYESDEVCYEDEEIANLGSKIDERIKHMSDSFSEYLMFLIQSKGMTNAEVHKRAIVDKKVFSKIKNNPDHHPNKLTAMCLCIGAKLNMDETKDLLARAGYALSPADKTDVIFSYFIEHEIYDMIELDIQLEEHGLKCIIT